MSNNNQILVIEDNKPIRKLFCTLLKRGGFETVDFDNASNALDWLNENTPNLIIMDILLPDMNGTELINEVKNIDINKDVKVIAVTGLATGEDRKKYLGAGFDDYISKPINTMTFVDDIKRVLN